MVNLSWDASQWCNIKKLEKNPMLGKDICFNIVKQIRVNNFFQNMYQLSKSK
jgi:hypothetical protein